MKTLHSGYKVVGARPQDIEWLRSIELAAARMLAGHAPDSVLNETTDEQEFRQAQSAGRLWVALADEQPVGFVQVELSGNGEPHLKEIDVHPDHGRRGIGRRLVEAACEWAALSGYSCITLTTFRDIPWNMPFYISAGFEVMASDELSETLRHIVTDETRRGLDPARRVVMKRLLSRRANDGASAVR